MSVKSPVQAKHIIRYIVDACVVVRVYKKWTLETKFQQPTLTVAETHRSIRAAVLTQQQVAVTAADCGASVPSATSASTTAA